MGTLRKVIGKTAMIAAVVVSTGAWAQTSSPQEIIDIPLMKAFVPPAGFDNNDDVQMVLTGYLPNACYRLIGTEVERDGAGRPIAVSQKAEVLRNGICAEHDELPAHLLEVVPFTTEVSLGRLPVGDYSVSYTRRETLRSAVAVATRNFSVTEALVPTVDNIKYANLSSVNVSPVVTEGQSVQAVLSGMLTSGCTDLAPHVQVTRVDDVVIVLPGLSVRANPFCTMVLRPFERSVELGSFAADTYLVHARSMSGRAVNSVFTAQPHTVRSR